MKTILRMMLLVIVSSAVASAQANPDWHAEFPGFKIAGNLYYVGTADLAVYLIRTPQGNILINGDFAEDVPTIRKSIESLASNTATRRSSSSATRTAITMKASGRSRKTPARASW